VEFEATWTPFYAMIPADAHEVLLVGVLDTDVLRGGGGALPPWFLAAWSCATLSVKHPTCDNEVFLHVRASS
jgi:hypothetical protein